MWIKILMTDFILLVSVMLLGVMTVDNDSIQTFCHAAALVFAAVLAGMGIYAVWCM
jgi:hypothetical protein